MQNLVVLDGKVLRVAGTDKLQYHFHELLAGQFRARKITKHGATMFGVQLLALFDSLFVGFFEFDPPIGLQLRKGYRVANG